MNRFHSWYRIQPRGFRALLTINVVVYLLWVIVLRHIDPVVGFFYSHLALNPGFPGILFEPWQLITYNFLHLGEGFFGLLHIGFNMLWLAWVGKDYEEMQGSHRMVAAYLLTGIGGGLLTAILHAAFPDVASFGGPVYGASGSVVGVMMVTAITYPFKSIGLMFIGTVRLLYVVIGFLALDILFFGSNNTSVSAHFGGALAGFLFARGEMNGMELSSWAKVFFPARNSRSTRSGGSSGGGALSRLESILGGGKKKGAESPRSATIHTMPQAEKKRVVDPIQGEVDRILDKITEHGYESLTEEEKRILYNASGKA